MDIPLEDRVTIVIVNWNTGRLLTECIESIAKLPEKSLIAEVVVIDNHSSDESMVSAKKVPIDIPVMMISLPENVGFAAANNMAIRQRRHKGTHVLLLNPDTQVKAQAVESALQELQHNLKSGIVGVKLLETNGLVQPSVRTFPTLGVLVFFYLKLQRLWPKAAIVQRYLLPSFDYDKRQAVDQVMGAMFLVRNQVIKKIGLLDENFWVWFEEVDYCKRTKDAGWEVVYTPTGSVVHHGGASFNQLVGFRKTLPFLNSGLYYASKHLGIGAVIVLVLLWPIAALLAIPASLLHTVVKVKNTKNL